MKILPIFSIRFTINFIYEWDLYACIYITSFSRDKNIVNEKLRLVTTSRASSESNKMDVTLTLIPFINSVHKYLCRHYLCAVYEYFTLHAFYVYIFSYLPLMMSHFRLLTNWRAEASISLYT